MTVHAWLIIMIIMIIIIIMEIRKDSNILHKFLPSAYRVEVDLIYMKKEKKMSHFSQSLPQVT